MSVSHEYIKTYARTISSNELRQLLESVWAKVQQANLYAGGPRGENSKEIVEVARQAFEAASHSHDTALTAESCRIMAHALNADEDYEAAIGYYRRAIGLLEEIGDLAKAARVRLGLIVALSMTGRHEEAFEPAEAAERWFLQVGDDLRRARLYTNLGNLLQRIDQHRRALDIACPRGPRQHLR